MNDRDDPSLATPRGGLPLSWVPPASPVSSGVAACPGAPAPVGDHGAPSVGSPAAPDQHGADGVEGFFSGLLKALPVALLVVDEERRVAFASGAAQVLFGPRVELIGRAAHELLDVARLEEARFALLKGPGRQRYEDTLRAHAQSDEAGPALDVAVTIDADLLTLEGREYLCLVLAHREEHERARAEWAAEPASVTSSRSLSPERLQLAYRFETLGQLTSSLSHEFNNLLSVIIASLELATRAIDRGDDPLSDIERAALAANRSAETVAHILRYARGPTEGDGPIDPVTVVQELSGLLERTILPGMDLVVEAQATRRVSVPRTELETAILNLVINARDAIAKKGEIRITVKELMVEGERATRADVIPGVYVSFRVTDNGVGVPESVRQRVFEPFFTTKPLGRGTGLGLSTVRTFARRRGGGVLLDSRLGSGTTIEFLLPPLGPRTFTAG